MNGDLGNLLTGELGEAEARFSHEDFAGEFGRRVAGRVRRRRAVRAAGVGGGTMLTAGALAVGATHMPWGVLGAAPGMGGSDCVTTSPPDGAHLVTVTVDGSDARSGAMVVTDPATGGVTLRGYMNSDGTWRVTDADGNPVEPTPGPGGGYVVNIDGATVGIDWPVSMATALPSDPAADGSFTYSVEAPDAAVSPGGSDDCFTPSPTESVVPTITSDIYPVPDPSLAAKPEDVIGDSPFECGFEFPTESYGTDDLWIDGLEWFTPAEMNTQVEQRLTRAGFQGDGVMTDVPQAIGSERAPTVTLHAPAGSGPVGGAVLGATDPALNPPNAEGLQGPTSNLAVPATGITFVAVQDGTVVGTIVDPWEPQAAPPVTWTADSEAHTLALLNPEMAFTSCPSTKAGTHAEMYAVAGKVTALGSGEVTAPEYAWLKVT